MIIYVCICAAICWNRGGFFHTLGYNPVLAMILFSGALILHCRQQDLKLRLDYLWVTQVCLCVYIYGSCTDVYAGLWCYNSCTLYKVGVQKGVCVFLLSILQRKLNVVQWHLKCNLIIHISRFISYTTPLWILCGYYVCHDLCFNRTEFVHHELLYKNSSFNSQKKFFTITNTNNLQSKLKHTEIVFMNLM